MKIVLVHPDIPQNTGNIIRTCSVTGADLLLVRPFSFSLSNRRLQRAGLDYAKEVNILEIDDLFTYLEQEGAPFFFFSSKANLSYEKVSYEKNSLLIFGSETLGLPSSFFERYPSRFVTIPMKKDSRCLNLSNAVAIALYEALRQQSFIF